jgi:molybdate transport system ATP-binding protein
MIRLKDVTVSLRNSVVFQNLNTCLEPGVSYLLEGKNGIGKTTFLNMLAGKIHPRAGTVQYDFIDETLDWDERYNLRKKYIHSIPTNALHELISTHELFYQQRYYTIEESSSPATVRSFLGDRIQNLAHLQLPDSFQLHHLLDIDLTRLSNGQIKKMIILKQLLDSIPKILLLDYPFEGLDAESRAELSEFLDHLHDVHQIQLIMADNEHAHLPRTLKKRILLQETGIQITERNQSYLPVAKENKNQKASDKKKRIAHSRDAECNN